MKKGDKAFVVLASQVFEAPWDGQNCIIVSYPDVPLGNMYVYDLDAGCLIRTNVETVTYAKKVREVDETDWGYSTVMHALGMQADEDLRGELAEYLKWND